MRWGVVENGSVCCESVQVDALHLATMLFHW